jgi:NAD(P)-dependent dehydrogenase (short-subunit alcohol dehydrogenase family)
MNIIINGGSHGIGREVAFYLAGDASNEVIITGRDLKAMQEMAGKMTNIHPVRADLSDHNAISANYLKAITGIFRNIDTVINMTGTLVREDFLRITDRDARIMMETNFFGPAAIVRILQPCLNRGAHIVNISSMGGFQGSVKFRGLAYYSASKAAVACLSECLAEELKEYDIRVNCLAIGAVQTQMLAEAFPGYKAPVEAAEIAPFIGHFALNAHKYINGRIIPVAMSNP